MSSAALKSSVSCEKGPLERIVRNIFILRLYLLVDWSGFTRLVGGADGSRTRDSALRTLRNPTLLQPHCAAGSRRTSQEVSTFGRTADLLVANEAFSQLNYQPVTTYFKDLQYNFLPSTLEYPRASTVLRSCRRRGRSSRYSLR